MNRFTIGIITFFLTFGFSTALVGLLFGFPEVNLSQSATSQAGRNIQNVLDRDVRYGEARRRSATILIRGMKRVASRQGTITEDQGVEFVREYSRIVETYSDLSSGIDASNTPADFQYAWKQHMDAWALEAKEASMRRFGDEVNTDEDSSEINSTWRQVLRIAERYGVPIKARYRR